jgi:hypothetical protein
MFAIFCEHDLENKGQPYPVTISGEQYRLYLCDACQFDHIEMHQSIRLSHNYGCLRGLNLAAQKGNHGTDRTVDRDL